MSATVIDLNDVAPGYGQPLRFDLDLIVQRLRETAEHWVPRLFPNGKRVGDEWRLANIRGDAPRNTGSCVIALRGPHAGDWIDFDGNEGGGPISTLEEATGLTGRDLIVEAADITGVAAVVALLLLGFLRGMIDGPTPLHLIEKPTPGTGATLMVDAVATILTGTGASVMTEGRDDEEWRKRVTAKLRQIPSIILIDNLRAKLDSSAVAAALTAPFWEDRVLGQSEMTRLPIRCLWIATGNNPEFSNEMARRLVRIRLDANVERPWQRGGFRHPDLMVWIRANRGRIVAACLTLCQAWIAAGKPRGSKTIGSYENWAQVIGGVLATAGIPGFLGNLEDMMAASDSEGAGWSAFIAAWWDRFGTAPVGAADLFDVAIFCDPSPPMSGGTERAQKTAFGISISRMRDRVFRLETRAVRVRKAGVSHKTTRWQLEICEAQTSSKTTNQPEVGGPLSSKGDLENGGPPSQPIENIGRGGPGGPIPTPSHMRMRAHAHDKEEPEKGPPGPPGPQTDGKTEAYGGGPRWGPQNEVPPRPPRPDWLKDLDP